MGRNFLLIFLPLIEIVQPTRSAESGAAVPLACFAQQHNTYVGSAPINHIPINRLFWGARTGRGPTIKAHEMCTQNLPARTTLRSAVFPMIFLPGAPSLRRRRRPSSPPAVQQQEEPPQGGLLVCGRRLLRSYECGECRDYYCAPPPPCLRLAAAVHPPVMCAVEVIF